MKLVKIRFTGWRDQREAPRSSDLQRKLDAWTEREHRLRSATLRVRLQQATADSEMLEVAAITTELTNTVAERAMLLSTEDAERNVTTGEARGHKKAGTFGYQVLSAAGTHVAMIVDEAGEYLPTRAAFSYEIMDDNPPLPEWAKKGKIRRFE